MQARVTTSSPGFQDLGADASQVLQHGPQVLGEAVFVPDVANKKTHSIRRCHKAWLFPTVSFRHWSG